MISVIIPTYNRVNFLARAIESVLNQTFKNFELIVVDDGSTDSTRELIKKYKEVLYIYQDNKGPSSARNTGIKHARYDFIAFLDSDDWWHKNKLKYQFYAMQDNPDYLVSHTQEKWYRNGVLLNQKAKHRKYSGFIFDKCLAICAISISTVMLKRQIFEVVGYFNEEMPCCEDYDFWLRVTCRFPVLLVDMSLTLKDGGRDDQVSKRYLTGMDKFRIESIRRLLESGVLNPQQRTLALAELERKCNIYGRGCQKHGKKEEGQYYLELASKIC